MNLLRLDGEHLLIILKALIVSALLYFHDYLSCIFSLYSIGAIAMESNGAIQSSVTDLLEPLGVDPKRIYINFFDMPRANVGWDRRTFAG